MLHEVQCDAFGGEHAARGAADEEDGLALLDARAILGIDADLDVRIEQVERGERERHAGEHAIGARDERGARMP